MKKLSEKDLELNPNVVTNLTDGGDYPRAETTDPCNGTNACGESVAEACSTDNSPCQNSQYLTGCNECNSNANCTGEDCYKTLQQNCGATIMCATSRSRDVQCCDTIMADACQYLTRPCPYSDNCETDLQCAETGDCNPIFPNETIEC